MAHSFEVDTVGVENKSTVIVFVVVWSGAGFTVVDATMQQRRCVECIDRLGRFRAQRDVYILRQRRDLTRTADNPIIGFVVRAETNHLHAPR